MDLQTPRRPRRQSGIPGSNSRRVSDMGSATAPASGLSTPRARVSYGASGQAAGDSSGMFTPGRTGTPARGRVRIEDRQEVDIQELIDEATAPLKSRKTASEDVWNLRLIEYFEIYRFCDASGRIDYTEAASALKATTNIYKNRVEYLKEKTNKFASNVVKSRVTGDEDEQNEEQSTETELTKDSLSLKKPKKRALDQPILVEQRKIQLKLNANINSIDPLFRKTQVDYDKGNYRALLLSSMVPDVRGRVSFEDLALKTQIEDKKLLSLDHDYLENDLEEFRGMLPHDYRQKQLVPKQQELNNLMRMDHFELADLDYTMDNTYMDGFGDVSYGGAEYEGNDGDILDDLDHEGEPAEQGDGSSPQSVPNISFQMDKDEVLAHMRVGDSRRSITFAQRKNIHDRQVSHLSSVSKPKRVKTKVGVAVDANLRLLRKKVMVKGDRHKMQLDPSMFQRRMQLLESIDLREFLRLYIRPDIKPETMWRTIERGRVGQDLSGRADRADQELPGEADRNPADQGLLDPNGEDNLEDLRVDKIEDPPDDKIDDMATQQLENYDDANHEDGIDVESRTDPGQTSFYSSNVSNNGSYLEQKSNLYLQRNVDVAVFKDNIWENYQEIQTQLQSESESSGITMDGIMKQTVEKYKQRTSPEVNDLVGPLFFLNLLHLANEKGITFGATNDYTQENIVIYPPSTADTAETPKRRRLSRNPS